MSATTVGTAPRRKVDQHETRAHLHEHERFVRRYRGAGLCVRCAAQAGYGHQMGFTHVHAPCGACAPLVATFPISKAGGWRAVLVRAEKASAVGVGSTLPHGRQVSDAHTVTPSSQVPSGIAA